MWFKRCQLFFILTVAVLSACGPFKRAAYEGFGDRDEWQFPDKVIESLNVKPGDVIADLGAGGGYFTFPLSTATGPKGLVYAVDVDSSMTEYIQLRAEKLTRGNIQVILSEPNDAKLPKEGVDLIFICNTYHHLENRPVFLEKMKGYLRANGRIAIIDFKKGESILGHDTPAATLLTEMKQAGYRVDENFDYLPKQNFMIFSALGQ